MSENEVSYLNSQYDATAAVDALLVIVSTGFIFLMQAGFAMVEVGSVREKNANNILIKNLFDACAGALAFYFVGYGFAFGQGGDAGGFIGGGNGGVFVASRFDTQESDHYLAWIFQFSFAATAATIVSGSLAERTMLGSYYMFSALMTGFIYPVIVSWTWGGGWLTTKGFTDFAGSGIVHMVGGVAGLCGALVVGPRHGKEKVIENRKNVLEDAEFLKMRSKVVDEDAFVEWVQERELQFKPNSTPFIVIGTFVLWVSWLFFNGGSNFAMTGTDRYTGVPKIIMNTILAGAAGGIVAAVLKPLVMGTYSKTHRYDVGALANGILGGLVAITAGCAAVQPWAALVIGIIGGIVYSLGCKVLWLIQADDPVEAAAVHGFCGIWGLIALGFFDNTQGLFCGTEKSGKFFGWQMLGMVVIVAWTAATSLIFFFVFKKLGILRV